MGKREKEWARQKRHWLLTELGGKCVNPECGETDFEKLTFDHIYGKDWETTGLSTDQRMCRYLKEHKLGLLQILCHVCNSKRGCPRQAKEKEKFRLLYKLDAACANGCTEVYKGDLHFVHVDPGWPHIELEGDAKDEAYAREMRAGRLSVFCTECLNPKPQQEEEEEAVCEPF